MKRFILITILSALSALLTGCGGGGGGTPAPNTRAVTTVYLFGHMTSTSKVATLHSELTVPEGIMVNYSSPPGGTGKYALRNGSVVPSGPVKVAQSDITAEFSVSDRKLTIDFVNSPDFTTQVRKNIRSGTAGSGIEIATINFKLAAADVLPVLPSPWQDLTVTVGEETGSLSIIYATGLKLNFSTSFMP
jgi:hypothetical protein